MAGPVASQRLKRRELAVAGLALENPGGAEVVVGLIGGDVVKYLEFSGSR